MTIKLLLVASLLGFAVLAFRSPVSAKSAAIRRMAGVGIALVAIIGVLAPSLVTAVAHRVGVGRGTDLLLYVFVIVSLFVWIGIYRRFHELERRFLVLNQRLALSGHPSPNDALVAPDTAGEARPAQPPTQFESP